MHIDKTVILKLAWGALMGIGLAGVINTVAILAMGLGTLHLGNVLPAAVGGLLFLVSAIKLLKGSKFKIIPWPWVRKGLVVCVMAGCMWCVVLMGLMEWGWPQLNDEAPEWIVIPGAGLRGYHLSATLKSRLDAGLTYWLQNPDAKIVVSGGQGADEPISEGKAMYTYLVEMGVPPECIFVEDKSASTVENIVFSKKVLEQSGYSQQAPVVFITNQYHMYRTLSIAKKNGISAVGRPVASPVSMILPGYLREFLALSKHLLTGR